MIRWILIGIVFGLVGYNISKVRGRNPVVWFFLCTFFPPFIIAVLLLPMMVSKGNTKKCIHCAEIIKEEASICKYCGMGNL